MTSSTSFVTAATGLVPSSMPSEESTQPAVALNPGEMDAMRIAFEILKHIKELMLPCLSGGQRECIRPDLFEEGPGTTYAACASQTKKGLVLAMSGHSPSITSGGEHSYYAITQWEGKVLPEAEYPSSDARLNRASIKVIWGRLAQEFVPKNT